MSYSAFSQYFYKFVISNGIREMFLGIGLADAIENKKYFHIPFVVCFPGIYCGYTLYQNRVIFISPRRTP